MLSVASPHDNLQIVLDGRNPGGALSSCSTCCSSCANERSQTRYVQGSTFTSLEHLLAAGSLTLSLLPGECLCSHQHAEDGFHALYDVHVLRPRVTVHDSELLNALSFLIKHRFILVSYMVTPSESKVVLRLYLIPCDLPGTRGVLRMRDEDKIVRPARIHLRKVLPRVTRNWASWKGEDGDFGQPTSEECFLPVDKDQRSLSQIFSDLTTTISGKYPEGIPRLRSVLYGYQKESVTTMLAMESSNRIINDPLYIPISGMTGGQFYIQPTTMELLLQCPHSYQVRGGLLCEELGTGKTVMTLALIIATLDELPDPPEGDGAEILTPLAFRHFPQYVDSELRHSVMRGKIQRRIRTANEKSRTVPSLVEILCDYTRKQPSSTNLRNAEDIPLYDCIRRNVPFFFHFHRDCETISARQKRSRPPRLMYLSSATLIVVPPALQAQWYSEILKHCSSSVRTLIVKSRKDLPPTVVLASDYDIVLTNFNVISMEAAGSKDLSPLDTGYDCQCPDFASVRIPDCSCLPPGTVSPLLRIRWKRLVRDEGHNAVSRSTELNYFLRAISAERRWIVSGTPTTNLLGLNFGSVTNDIAETEEVLPNESDESPGLTPRSIDPDPQAIVLGQSGSPSSGLADCRQFRYSTTWNRTDRADLRKLGSMLSDFLGVLPFAAQPDSFSNLVINGLMNEAEPLPGTRRVLEQVMMANMVRHRVSEIERHVRLPPLNKELILLDLEEYGRMTYNVLLSFVAVNAVDSERRDMDYLFHPSKTAALASTIENLSQSLFWRSDEDAFDNELAENIHRAENAIQHALERGQPEEDILLVQKAIWHLQNARDNMQYRDMQHGLELPYHIHNASQRLRQTWGLVHEPEYALKESAPFLVYPSYALELRDAVVRQPLIKEDSLAVRAQFLRAKNSALAALIDAHKSRADRRSDSKSPSQKRRRREEVQIGRARLDSARRTATVDSKAKLEELHREFRIAQERLKDEDAKEDPMDTDADTSRSAPLMSNENGPNDILSARNRLLWRSPYAQLRVGNSTSSKLNYILDEVRKYSATEKFLIFSSQPFNLVHISEGLDLMGVKYLHFMKDVTNSRGKELQRDQWLTTFETSETYRVFLMELKYGARGLNIVSASRVIFCEPVWRADVESQAIKRVHRIGQRRPVTVKTLAIRGTFEEYMLQRRRDFKGSGSKTPGLAEEWGIRNYLQHPVFLEKPSQNAVNLDLPLLPIPESNTPIAGYASGNVYTTAERSEGDRMEHETIVGVTRMVDQPYSSEQPSPKRRKVHFN